MTHQHSFRVEDVTCEKCDIRIREALESLPGVQHIEMVRTPSDEAEVVLQSSQIIAPELIEERIAQKPAGTTHHYRVLWTRA